MAEDVKSEVVQEPTDTGSLPVAKDPAVDTNLEEANKEVEDQLKAEPKEEGQDSEEETPEEPKAEEPEDKTEDVQPKSAEARKEQLNAEIRDLVSKRNELRQEIKSVNDQVYQPQSAQELINTGMDPALARVEALEQRTQMAEYNAQVADLNANLNVESLNVMRDFPVFDPDSSEYDKSLADRVGSLYQRVANIQTDPNTGLTIQASVLPYDFYKTFAESVNSGTVQGSVKGQRDAEKMLSAAEPSSSSAPKEKPQDNFLKGLLGET